jgi:glycosyltransferase involved in cell wall biosynthesis
MSTSKPLVSAMMMTGWQAGRAQWASLALRSFVRQTYGPRELVIVNQSLGTEWAYSVLDPRKPPQSADAALPRTRRMASKADAEVREYFLERPPTLGELRNVGLLYARGELVLSWDDDDWSHHRRLERMIIAWRQHRRAVTLSSHVRYSTVRNTAYAYHNSGGCGGLLLYPREEAHYGRMESGEDSDLYLDQFGEAYVLKNGRDPHLYLRFYHGDNVGSERHIMRKYAEDKWHNRWVGHPKENGRLPQASAEYLAKVLEKEYGDTNARENLTPARFR